MKETRKNLKTNTVHRIFQSIYKTMLSYCLKCRKNTEIKNLNVVTTKNERMMLLQKCAVCNSKKLKFIKEQEAGELGIKTQFRNNNAISIIPLICSLLL